MQRHLTTSGGLRRPLVAAVAATAACYWARAAAAQDAPVAVVGNDLSAAASYATGSLPTTATDVVFNASSYAATTFAYNTAGGTLAVGTLNSAYNASALSIVNGVAGSTSTIALSTPGNSFSGTAADLLYVGPGSQLAIGGGAGTLNVTLRASGNIDVAGASATATVASVVAGNYGLTKTGTGLLNLAAAANTFTGPFTMAAGQVSVSSLAALGTGPINYSGQAFLSYSPAANETTARAVQLTATTANTATFFAFQAGRTLTLNGGVTANGAGAQTLDFTGFSNGGTVRINGTVADGTAAGNTSALSFDASSDPATPTAAASPVTYVLAGSNTYSGGTVVNTNGAVVAVANNAALGSGTVTFAGSGGGAIFAAADSNSYAMSNRVSVGGGPITFGTVGTGNLRFTSTANVTLAGSRTIAVVNTTEFDANFRGAGTALNKAGAGTLVLAGSNTFTGGTTVNGGTLQLGAGGTTGSLYASGGIALNGTLAFNRSNTAAQGTDFGSIADFDPAAPYDLNVGGVVQRGAGTVSLTAANTYSNGTTAAAGTLLANNATQSFGTGPTTIAGGTLGGSGATGPNQAYDPDSGDFNTVPVTFSSGTITGGNGSTGAGSIGRLTLGPNAGRGSEVGLALAGTADTYAAKFDGRNVSSAATATVATARTGTLTVLTGASDTLVLSGLTVAGGGGLLLVNPVAVTAGTPAFATGQRANFVIADATASATALGNAFALSMPANSAGSYALDTAPDGSGGEYLILEFTAAPEPGSLVLAATAIVPLALGRHRRGRRARASF